jgi:plasmid stability protein
MKNHAQHRKLVMTDVRIRNVDDWIVEWHRHQAKRDGRSLESELREVITQAALAKKHEIAQEMRDALDELRSKYGTFSDSTVGIREDRDRRG